ncbi:MAG: anhydro-N-acetylmuramic acid kinase [Chloroflexota bacterium]|nr:MAG: anhydro-N-acetylmuramic acid kinase [Chloroflexota bacterium]
MLIVGLMSGTSADGIDAALCEISGQPPQLNLRLVHALMYPYPEGFQQRILNTCIPELSRVDDICQLNFDMGELFAQAALAVIREAGIDPKSVDLIGSHGQTVWHMVRGEGEVTATLQITEASVIAERTGITTINNFRPRDVAAGGQGAPLTGYADWLLLRHPTEWRAIQNIGGMGNVTFLPPLSDSQSEPLAFDTGPGNALIDSAVSLLTNGAQAYDRDAQMARRGTIDEDWLTELLAHPYYRLQPPKTTGRELFGAAMAEDLIRQARARGLSDESILATLTVLTAQSIADAYQNFAPAPVAEVILGGGGSHNPMIVDLLRGLLHPARVMTHEDIGLDSDNKEALVFALLAYETWHGRPGNYPALTGARRPVILGQITPGDNYADLLRRTWCG